MKEKDICMDCIHKLNKTDGKIDCDVFGLMSIPIKYCGYFELPKNYGEIMAKRSMELLNNMIHDIVNGNQEKLDSHHFNEPFIKSVKDREKQKSIETNDLNQLFDLKKEEDLLSEKIKQVSVYDGEHRYYRVQYEITDNLLKEVLQDFTIKNRIAYYELYYKGVDYETITDGFFDYHMNKQFCDPEDYSDHEKKVILELYNETDEKKKMVFQVFKTRTPLKIMVEIIREE